MIFKKKENNLQPNFMQYGLKPKRQASNWIKGLTIFGSILLILALFIMVPLAVAGAFIGVNLTNANKQVDDLWQSLKTENWSAVETNLIGLESNIDQIDYRLGGLGLVLYWPSIGDKVKVSRQFLGASSDLLDGYGKLFNFIKNLDSQLKLDNSNLDLSSPQVRKALLQSIENNQATFAEIRGGIDKAKLKLSGINAEEIIGLGKDKLLEINSLLNQAVSGSEMMLPIVTKLPKLLGLNQERNYLLIFQNNTELRPTGGFIGSYGIITIENGDIKGIFTDDVYNLDKFSEGKLSIPAPAPMIRYNRIKDWYLRDANWSPDWPTSARQIVWFFNIERTNAGLAPIKLDGVIAITPDVVSDLLNVVGPLVIDGQTLHADNFTRELEMLVEFEYAKKGISKENRKEVINDISKILLGRITSLAPKDYLRIWQIFKNSIDEKHILVYLTDTEMQKYFADQNWSGEVKGSEGDYAMVIDANLAALKTDQAIKRSIDYKLKVDDQGDLISSLRVTYKHTSKYVKDLISNYRTYTRVYLPAGSTVIKASLIDDQGREENLGLNSLEIKDELGKTSVAVFLTVEPERSKTLKLEYKLSENIRSQYENGMYKFLVQKQPGTNGHNLKIELDFRRNISAYVGPSKPAYFKGKSISFTTDLKVDREVKIKF